ncbi:MAG: flagellar biosynthesis anti-sigma factor FlgM [Bryobacteraceae bacterium]
MRKGDNFSKPTHSIGGAAAAPAPAKKRTELELREARIDELRKLYLTGSYQVDSAELARKLIYTHLRK